MSEEFLKTTMAVRLDSEGFSVSVYDPASVKGFRRVDYETNPAISLIANVRRMLVEGKLKSFRSGRIAFLFTSPVVLIPRQILEDEAKDNPREMERKAAEIASLTLSEGGKGDLCLNLLPSLDTYAAFTLEKGLRQILLDEFPEAAFCSVLSPVTAHFADLSRKGNTRKLYLYFYGRKMCVEGFERGTLTFFNVFDIEGDANNALYYTAGVWTSLGMSQEEDYLYFTGTSTEMKTVLMTSLNRFYRHVFYLNPASEFNQTAFREVDKVAYDVQTYLTYGF